MSHNKDLPPGNGRRRQAGFTLIEVLVALLILSVGLLGLAGLQATALRFNHDAQLRSQASLLAFDMLERMRANSHAADDYSNTYAHLDCTDGFSLNAGSPVAANDIAEWRQSLSCLLPMGNGRIVLEDNTATVTVLWSEDRGSEPNAPDDAQQSFSFSARL